MFFQSLQSLLEANESVVVSLSQKDGLMTVTVTAKGKEGVEGALKAPLVLTSTAAELDAEFAQVVSQYSVARKSLAEQLAETNAILEQEKKASAAKAVKASKKVPPATAGSDADKADPATDDSATSQTQSQSANKKADTGGLDLASLL